MEYTGAAGLVGTEKIFSTPRFVLTWKSESVI
jgi:hypothetical protein